MFNEYYVAERIIELCEKQNISRYQLARRSGMSESSISNLLNRHSDPRFTTLYRICEGFGMTMSQFFLPDGEKLDLTAEQKQLLDTWEKLSDEEKRLVSAYIDGIQKKSQPSISSVNRADCPYRR